MTTKTLSQINASPDTLLRRALLGNALFSGLSGLFFLLASGAISQFLGWPSSIPVSVIGLTLLVYGPLLYRIASQTPIDLRLALGAVIGDDLWVFGSFLILVTGWVPLTTPGKWAVAIVALFVLDFAILQFIGIRKVKKNM